MKISITAFLFFLGIASAQSFAQTKTNLELINNLVSRTVIKTEPLLPAGSPVSLSVNTTQSLEIIRSRILSEFNRRGFGVFPDGEVPKMSLSYTLISAGIEYKDSFSDGIFGSILVERSIHVNSSVIISKSGQMSPPEEFIETMKDTIRLSEIAAVEDRSIPFTRAPVPSLPLLSTFWEPILVVGTLIGAVILLFTVRSK